MGIRQLSVRLLTACIGCALACSWASADVVNVIAIKDNTLYQSATGNLSNGEGDSFFAGRTIQAQDDLRRGLLAFDVAGSLPAGATITSVTLSLQCLQSISSDHPMSLHRASQDWGESTSNANGIGGGGAGAFTAPGDATWLHTFSPSGFWTNPGGDFAAVPSATTLVGFGGFIYQWTSAQMALDVQNWLDNPAGNFGWVLLGNESVSGSAKRFASHETQDIFAIKPTLTIEYIPEPATAAMLAVGLLALTRRRRGL